MRVDDDQKTYIWDDMILSADPTGSTPVFEVTLGDTQISGSPFAMTWVATPVEATPGTFTQTARTNVIFCGSNATASGSDVKPGKVSCYAQTRIVLLDGQIVTGELHRLEFE